MSTEHGHCQERKPTAQASGQAPVGRFVTETIGLDDIDAASERMHRGDVLLRSVVVL